MLTDAKFIVEFDEEHSYVMSQDQSKYFITSNKNGNMYPLDIELMIDKPQLCFLLKADFDESWLWHRRLAHLDFKYIKKLFTGELVRGMSLLKFFSNTLCAACECGKIIRK